MLNFNIFKILIPNIQSSISLSSIKFVDREYEVHIIQMFSNCLLYRVHQCMGQQGHPVPVSCHDYNSVHTELVIS